MYCLVCRPTNLCGGSCARVLGATYIRAHGTPLFVELSAGDLDEALAVMLRFRNPTFDASLFERTDGFREGFMEGEAACGR